VDSFAVCGWFGMRHETTGWPMAMLSITRPA